MTAKSVKFALNHMSCPALNPLQLLEVAKELGDGAVELRNDVRENSISDLKTATEIGERARELGVRVLTINALYPFNVWDEERISQARHLASLCRAVGAEALVCCPLNSGEHSKDDHIRLSQLRDALRGLKPILQEFGLQGLIEPLGFPISSLRLKREAVDAIYSVGAEDCFKLVHDTFHHKGAQEREYFPGMTGLVHASGVEDEISTDDMLDGHRVFVGPNDRLDNLEQIRSLLNAGYGGFVSFEPFSDEMWHQEDPAASIANSMEYIRSNL